MTRQSNVLFGFLDEDAKKEIRRALLKAVALPGYIVPFASREMPIARGWGTGGFKATPGSANVFAYTIARDEPHPINAPFTLERFTTGRLIDEAAAAAVAH